MNIADKEFIIDSFYDEIDNVTKWFVLLDKDFDTEKDAENFVTVLKLNLNLK